MGRAPSSIALTKSNLEQTKTCTIMEFVYLSRLTNCEDAIWPTIIMFVPTKDFQEALQSKVLRVEPSINNAEETLAWESSGQDDVFVRVKNVMNRELSYGAFHAS